MRSIEIALTEVAVVRGARSASAVGTVDHLVVREIVRADYIGRGIGSGVDGLWRLELASARRRTKREEREPGGHRDTSEGSMASREAHSSDAGGRRPSAGALGTLHRWPRVSQGTLGSQLQKSVPPVPLHGLPLQQGNPLLQTSPLALQAPPSAEASAALSVAPPSDGGDGDGDEQPARTRREKETAMRNI